MSETLCSRAQNCCGCRLRRQQQEQEVLAPAADEEEEDEEEEESEYETDSEDEGFGRAMLKPVFVPKVEHLSRPLTTPPSVQHDSSPAWTHAASSFYHACFHRAHLACAVRSSPVWMLL